MSRFIELTIQSYMVLHGYDERGREITEDVHIELPSKKLIAIDRIKSISGKYILTDYAFGKLIFWEYLDGYEAVSQKLEQANALIR
jgi:hypothetical protein